MKTLPKEIAQLFDFLQHGTSAFHVVKHSKQVLLTAGFEECKFNAPWNLKKGGR